MADAAHAATAPTDPPPNVGEESFAGEESQNYGEDSFADEQPHGRFYECPDNIADKCTNCNSDAESRSGTSDCGQQTAI